MRADSLCIDTEHRTSSVLYDSIYIKNFSPSSSNSVMICLPSSILWLDYTGIDVSRGTSKFPIEVKIKNIRTDSVAENQTIVDIYKA